MQKNLKQAAVVLTAVVAVLAASVVAAPSRGATGGNDSVFIYDRQSGTAVVGTMSAGTFTHVQTLNVGRGWTAAAASSDSLMLYKGGINSLIESGHFRNGVYVPVERRYGQARSFSHLTASCDSYLLYRSDGVYEAGTLSNGIATMTSTGSGVAPRSRLASSSCDTVRFVRLTNGDANHQGAVNELGILQGGTLTMTGTFEEQNASDEEKPAYTHLASTSEQQLVYAALDPQGYGFGVWNGAVGGGLGVDEGFAGGSFQGFSTHWDIVSGTADTLIFYDQASGQTATATLDMDGTFTQHNVYGWSAGWDLIAGGK